MRSDDNLNSGSESAHAAPNPTVIAASEPTPEPPAAIASDKTAEAIMSPATKRVRLSRRDRKANAWQGRECENCQVALQGPFCHVCGQPERTPVRALVALSADAFDYLFDLDSRLLNTLKNLFFRPGRLTEAYLRGQRMSFVRPLRIYIVVSALLFVVISSTTGDLAVNVDDEAVNIGPPDATSESAKPLAPESQVGVVVAASDATRTSDPVVTAEPDPAPSTELAPPPPPPPILLPVRDRTERKPISVTILGSEAWHPVDNPLEFAVFPAAVNHQINVFIGTVIQKAELARENPKRLGHEFLRVLPQSMFVLLPIFALLLKLVLIFKRRLYMEHLMVAVHSHTFIFMGILLAVSLSMIDNYWPATWFNPWGLLTGLAVSWIPINLFLTQKRVYRQSFLGAAFGSLIISTLYLLLVSFTALGALVLSLVNL